MLDQKRGNAFRCVLRQESHEVRVPTNDGRPRSFWGIEHDDGVRGMVVFAFPCIKFFLVPRDPFYLDARASTSTATRGREKGGQLFAVGAMS